MIDIERTEEEQIAAFRQWFKESGRSLLIGAGIAVAIIAAYRFWQYEDLKARTEASDIFQGLVVEMVAQPDIGNVDLAPAQVLTEKYSNTRYSEFAYLFLARKAAQAGDFSSAVQQLNLVLAQNPDEPIASLARYRLASALFADGKADEALVELAEPIVAQFNFLKQELRGDILYSKKDYVQASAAYTLAKTAAAETGHNADVIAMKLVDAQGLAGS